MECDPHWRGSSRCWPSIFPGTAGPRRSTSDRGPAVPDAIEADLDAMGVGRIHVLGNSSGARIAIELAKHDRALSVVAIAPSGMNIVPERIFQGVAMGTSRLLMRGLRPVIADLARSAAGRTALLTGLRSRPWDASETEARAVSGGFAEATGFWPLLCWGILADVPTGLQAIRCPVVLAQGTGDLISSAQTPRYLLIIPGSTFRPLFGAGHAPQSDGPQAVLQLVRGAVRRADRLSG
ncbi:alpha/beta fold hydrolase [Pseudonocardia saturnea]